MFELSGSYCTTNMGSSASKKQPDIACNLLGPVAGNLRSLVAQLP